MNEQTQHKVEVSQKSKELAANYRQKRSGKVYESTEDASLEWITRNDKKQWEQQAKRAHKEREMKECTFQPATYTDKSKPVAPSETVNRLYAQRKPQIEKTDKTREEFEFEKAQNECTFAP